MASLFPSLSFLILFPIFAGCAIGVPQNRQEFVTMYKDSKVFGKAEHFTINRPSKGPVWSNGFVMAELIT